MKKVLMIKKEDIAKLILKEKENSFSSHLNLILSYDFTRYYGEIREQEILLWSSSFWNRSSYPVFVLKFDIHNNLTGIKREKNPFSAFMEKVLLLKIAGLIVMFFAIMDTGGASILSLILIVFSILFYILIRNQLAIEEKNLLGDLKNEIFEIEKRNNPALKINLNSVQDEIREFTFPKILLRVFLYPICLGIIYVSAVVLLPSEKPFYGILLMGIGCGYLISDAGIIFKNKVNKI